jgi:hypothetical protein
MQRTICFKLRANNHDRHRIGVAMARWSAGMNEALDRARADQQSLLRCLLLWTSKDGKRQKLVVDKKRLRLLVRQYCAGASQDLHSSVAASRLVALEATLSSWLGQYSLWVKEKRQAVKPAFPAYPNSGSVQQTRARWPLLLEEGRDRVMRVPEEDQWRAALTREARDRRLPLYFGAASSGSPVGTVPFQMAHCGIVRRADRRYFALLTLWGQQDPLGEPFQRARNRVERGPNVNVRTPDSELRAAPKATSSMVIPLEYGSGPGARTKRWERVAFGRGEGKPQSAQLVERNGEYYLHVSFEYPDRPRRPLSGAVLSVRRGITTLIAAAVVAPDGTVGQAVAVDGRDLQRRITEIRKYRALKQEKGQTTKGDRKASRITEHVLYSAGHQLIDLACRHGAEIVLLSDPTARVPQPFLGYKHFHQLYEILLQLAEEAGLPPPREREIYGSPAVCTQCGWAPGDAAGADPVEGDREEPRCPRCQAPRSAEFQKPVLLGLDTLRFRAYPTGVEETNGTNGAGPGKKAGTRPTLGAFIRLLRGVA